jgi:5-methylcytosine-specific restriction endonuclease McrA
MGGGRVIMDYFISPVSDAEIKKEREKARALRNSTWWIRRLAQGICHYCGRTFLPRELTMDHIVPVIRGGRSTKGNIVPACKDCNSKKKHMLPIEWEEYLQNLREEQED